MWLKYDSVRDILIIIIFIKQGRAFRKWKPCIIFWPKRTMCWLPLYPNMQCAVQSEAGYGALKAHWLPWILTTCLVNSGVNSSAQTLLAKKHSLRNGSMQISRGLVGDNRRVLEPGGARAAEFDILAFIKTKACLSCFFPIPSRPPVAHDLHSSLFSPSHLIPHCGILQCLHCGARRVRHSGLGWAEELAVLLIFSS